MVIDNAKLAEEQGSAAQALDPTVQQRLLLEAGAAFIKPFEEKTYFKSLKAQDVEGLPAGLDSASFVQFQVDASNAAGAMDTVVQQALPAVLDVLMSNEAYLKAFNLDQAKAEDNKKQLADNQSEVSKKLKQQLKLGQIQLIGGIKGGKLAYQSLDTDVEYSGGKSPLKLKLHADTAYSKLGEKPASSTEIPTDAIPVEQLQALLAAGAK